MKGGENMCCNTEKHDGGCQCGCHHDCCCAHGRHSPSDRVFWTKAEKVAWLEEYLEGLREEVKAVEERIGKLQAEG
jgi:hypothetical protein